jgi:hypothetical protein
VARPKKQTVDYYPHMAKPGQTIFIIESRWGNDGYAFFHKLLELLCSSDGHVIDYGNPSEKEFLLAKTRVNDETAAGILDFLAEVGKIDAELWSVNVIWYQNLVDNIKDAYRKRINEFPSKPSLSSFRSLKPPSIELPTPETPLKDVYTAGSTESKVKEIIVYYPPISPLGEPPETPSENDQIDYQGILDEYNSICTKMPKAEKLQDDRRKNIRIRIKDYGRDAISFVFGYAAKSPHHNGQNDMGWCADFDWLMGPKNFRKMLERARSGTKPAGNGQKPVQGRTAEAMAAGDKFMELISRDPRYAEKNIRHGGPKLPARS